MNEIIRIAEKEIGVSEAPKNSNNTKYNKWFGLPKMPWCGMFVSWCYAMAGFQLPKIGFSKGFAGCQTAVAYFKKNNQITTEPQEGDIVFFDWNKDGRYDHTGIFVKWIDDNNFETIEGNTAVGNDSNGGTVMKRKRDKTKANVLFVNVPV
jgi:CHAP domain